MFLENDNEKGDETEYRSNTLQTLDENRNKSNPDKYVNKGFSSEIEQQLEELNEYEYKINGLLLKKITEFSKENKILTGIIKTSVIKLDSLKKSLQKAQKDVEIVKEKSEMLHLTNKDLLKKFKTFNKLPMHNDDKHSETVPRKKIISVKENNNTLSSKTNLKIKGLLVI